MRCSPSEQAEKRPEATVVPPPRGRGLEGRPRRAFKTFAAFAFMALALISPATAADAPSPKAAEAPTDPRFDETVATAGALPHLNALIVARDGKVLLERRFRGPDLDRPVNIKSASKSVVSALVGIAIQRGVFTGEDQTVGSLLAASIPEDADPRVRDITVGNLVSMRSGLETTSGRQYGAWIASRNWVRDVLSRPFVDVPGGRMLYSTGSTHLLGAMLARASGKNLHELAREWLGKPLGITIPRWPRDPQGLFRGGNDMELSPRALLRFGELYRNDGVMDGERILPEGWVASSWTMRTMSPWNGNGYGYGWFTREARGHDVKFAWGYGGQMVYVVPDLGLTVVTTSDSMPRPRGDGHIDALHALLADSIIPAVADDPAALAPSQEEHHGESHEGGHKDQS